MSLDLRPALSAPELLADPVAEAIAALDPEIAARIRVAPIDATLADTAAFCEAYDVAPEASANCVVVFGRRGEDSVHAAVLVLATDKADVNKTVRKELGMRKMSFADQPTAEALTGMTQGGITPVGLPGDWPVLVDTRVVAQPWLVIGSGLRRSKIAIAGEAIAGLPRVEVLDLTISQS